MRRLFRKRLVERAGVPIWKENQVTVDWTQESVLGSGGRAVVRVARVQGKVHAIKMYRCGSWDNLISLEKELRILRSLRGIDSVVQIQGLFVNRYGEPALVMKRYPVSLYREIQNNPCLPDSTFRGISLTWAQSIVQAVVAIHQRGIVHGDIKSHNCLVDGKKIVLADFGEAATQLDTAIKIGTRGWIAPEVQHSPVSMSSDVYSLGITIMEMIQGTELSINGTVPCCWFHCTLVSMVQGQDRPTAKQIQHSITLE